MYSFIYHDFRARRRRSHFAPIYILGCIYGAHYKHFDLGIGSKWRAPNVSPKCAVHFFLSVNTHIGVGIWHAIEIPIQSGRDLLAQYFKLPGEDKLRSILSEILILSA